jgi:hypothetical protein
VVGGLILGAAITSAIDAHAEREREEAWQREHDVPPRVYVIYDHGGPPPRAAVPPPLPEPPPVIAFDATATRDALARVDLSECRAAGAPRGYGHAKATVNPSGDVSKVVVEEPSGMPPAAVQCIGAALGRVTVPEFTGSYVVVGTTFFVP